jgi:hypothetical protein
VPYGETTEGFGGTYATQENFRLMRAALDEVGEELGRYIRLCNYASGLCMPEIATMGALERLDMMLNDSMYGIIFRNINMQRTFVDQYRLSRCPHRTPLRPPTSASSFSSSSASIPSPSPSARPSTPSTRSMSPTGALTPA